MQAAGDEVSRARAVKFALRTAAPTTARRAAAAMNPEEVRAGALVGAGALLAGPLYKRSAWKREWNRRFVVLTTETLTWYKSEAGDVGEECRAVLVNSEMAFGRERDTKMPTETLVLTSGGSKLLFCAESPAELDAWREALQALVTTLQTEGRYARLHIREKTSLFASPPWAELPHLGSRNLRERRPVKTFYACGVAGAPAPSRRPSLLGKKAPELALLCLVQLPPSALSEREANAFGEVAAALRAARHPFVSPALHADVAAADDQQRAVTYRRFAPLGSLKDAIHGCSDPRASYGVKYGFLERAAAAPTAAAAGAATGAAASATADGGPQHVGSALPAAKVALYGRMVLEALRFCRAAGLPCVHLHSGNVLLEDASGSGGGGGGPRSSTSGGGIGGAVCVVAEVELALLRLPAYSELLAKPRLPPGGGSFRVAREVLAFGHLLFEMVTGAELTAREIANWERALGAGALFPGPPAAWALLATIFLPAAGASAAPTLVDLLADPFFSVALPLAAPPAAPLDLHGSAAELIRAARRHYGDEVVCSPPGDAASPEAKPKRSKRTKPESARRKSKQAAAAADDAAPSPPPEPALAEASLDAQLAAASLAEEPEGEDAEGADASAARQSIFDDE